MTEKELKTLLGDYYDTLIALWEKYDPYFLAVLRKVEGGGSITASLLGGIELHFEGSGADIQARVYNGEFSNKLWEWQGKGVYSVRNAGMTDEQVAREKDELFSQYAEHGWMQQPVFDYALEYGDIQYLGARVLKQNIDWQVTSLSGEVFGEFPTIAGPIGKLLGISYKLSLGAGLVVALGDIAAGTLWKSLSSPREYALVPYTTLNECLIPVDMTFSPFVPLSDLGR